MDRFRLFFTADSKLSLKACTKLHNFTTKRGNNYIFIVDESNFFFIFFKRTFETQINAIVDAFNAFMAPKNEAKANFNE